MKSGIYAIVRKGTTQAYVGQSVNVNRRWMGHKRALARGEHHCAYLQRAWNKYGADSFEFVHLVCCSRSSLNEYEAACFKQFELYNSHKTAGTGHHIGHGLSYVMTVAHKQKISAANVGRGRPHTADTKQKLSQKAILRRGARTVSAVNTSGQQLFFKTLTEAAKALGVSLQTVSNCIRGHQRQTNGWVITVL